MIDFFNSYLGKLFDSFFFAVGWNLWVAITTLAFLTGVSMLLAYRLASNQQRIRTVKDKMVAHLLEMRLYSTSLPLTFRAQANLLRYNLLYLSHSLRPMLVIIVPLALALAHIDQWLGYQPLLPGETSIIKVRLKDGYAPSQQVISLQPSPGFLVDAPPVRIDREGEVDWRIRASEPGTWNMTLMIGREALAKRIVVGGNALARISAVKVARNWIDQLASPGEAALPQTSAAAMVEIGYPSRRIALFGWRMHWLIPYFALSVLSGLLFKPLFKVVI